MRSWAVSPPRSAPGSRWRSGRALGYRRVHRPRQPALRGGITGVGTFVGGVLHSLPFLIPDYRAALITAFVVVALELVALAALRARFFSTRFTTSLGAVSLAGAVIAPSAS